MAKRKTLIGKIGWCNKRTLGLKQGHYVFIRKKKKNGLCDVNTLTSIGTGDGHYQLTKVKKIEQGIIYPIPKSDDTLPKFGGIDKRVIRDVPLSKIYEIGRYRVKKKHYPYILKHMK